MQIIEYILKATEYSLFVYIAMSSIYIFVFAVAGHFYKKRENDKTNFENKIAVLIPAYKEDVVILEIAKSALKQNYNPSRYDVVVIADSLKQETIKNLKKLPIIVVEVSFKNSTKAKALNMAMSKLRNNYDHAVVLDADNIMEADFLKKMNTAFKSGFQIVQGHRKAKNRNTSYAILDAASEEINNHIFRKGHNVLGFSSGLIGSGMGFEYPLFKSIMKSVNAIGGFDKELEFKFASEHIQIEYLHDAIVLDEKIEKLSDFSNQRRRWLSTQFVFLRKNFLKGWTELLLKGNVNFFDKVVQMIIPPRVLLLGATVLVTLVYVLLEYIMKVSTAIPSVFWMLNLGVVIVAFLLALPKIFYNANTLKAILSLPSAFFTMFLLLFKMKGANKKFIHTTHGVIQN